MLYGDGIHDDTLALQALLDQRGVVTLDKPGTYLIHRTLIIRSNTRFILSPGAHLLAAPLSRCALMENEHFAGGGRDANIEITGGVWDGNCDAMGLDAVWEAKHREDQPYHPSLFKGKLIRFAHVDCLHLSRMTVRNPVSYGIQIADARTYIVRDLFFDYNWHFGTTDGIHINGPCRDGLIENLSGTTNDDMIGVTTIDETHAEITAGEIANLVIRNISACNGYSGVRLLSAGGHALKHVHICGVYGDYRHNAVLISHHNTRPNTPIWFDDITVEHVHACKSATPLDETCFRYWEGANDRLPIVWLEGGIHAGSITLRDISRHEEHPTQGHLIQIDKGSAIQRLVMDNIHQTAEAGLEIPFVTNEAHVDCLIQRDVG